MGADSEPKKGHATKQRPKPITIADSFFIFCIVGTLTEARYEFHSEPNHEPRVYRLNPDSLSKRILATMESSALVRHWAAEFQEHAVQMDGVDSVTWLEEYGSSNMSVRRTQAAAKRTSQVKWVVLAKVVPVKPARRESLLRSRMLAGFSQVESLYANGHCDVHRCLHLVKRRTNLLSTTAFYLERA